MKKAGQARLFSKTLKPCKRASRGAALEQQTSHAQASEVSLAVYVPVAQLEKVYVVLNGLPGAALLIFFEFKRWLASRAKHRENALSKRPVSGELPRRLNFH